jgi:excisionase family DNA binding protein
MPRRSEAELTEIGWLFRLKLRQLREQEGPPPSAHTAALTRGPSAPRPPGDDDVLGPIAVARLLGVHPKTVTRWAHEGMPCFRTIGGHRRFRRGDVAAWLGQTREPS